MIRLAIAAAVVLGVASVASATDPILEAEALRQVRDDGKHSISPSEIEHLRTRGLARPIEELIASLVKNPRVIDLPTRKAPWRFDEPEQVRILDGHWVYAPFSDGHFAGAGIFRYEVDADGNIEWDCVVARTH